MNDLTISKLGSLSTLPIPKYYRFISESECQALITNKVVTNIHNRPLHILPERPTAFITPNTVNHNISIENLLASNYPRKTDFTKEVFLSYMLGTVSHDYLVELNLPSPPSMSNLGWYYNDENTELCLVEYCITQYSLDQVVNIYTGDFCDWKNIKTWDKAVILNVQQNSNNMLLPTLGLPHILETTKGQTESVATNIRGVPFETSTKTIVIPESRHGYTVSDSNHTN